MSDLKSNVERILQRKWPTHIVYAPNYWQWFSHHQQHHTLPPEIQHCQSQLDLINHLGLAVFSRNVYCNQRDCWFGGLAQEQVEGVDIAVAHEHDGQDTITTRTYRTPLGSLTERLRYVFAESTLVQEKFLIEDYAREARALHYLLERRRWVFSISDYQRQHQRLGSAGILVAGELYSPLKMLHLLMGPMATVYFLAGHPNEASTLLRLHEQAQLDLLRQIVVAGAPAVMSMDNLDTMFHPPAHVEAYSASFYEKASQICHEHGSTFFIHACGRQRDNLKLIASLGVDGLEGVAFPPLGDVELDEALELTGPNFIITGGISAHQFDGLNSREAVFQYVEGLLERMRPFAHRFMLSASCNTPIDAAWPAILAFRNAWRQCSPLR